MLPNGPCIFKHEINAFAPMLKQAQNSLMGHQGQWWCSSNLQYLGRVQNENLLSLVNKFRVVGIRTFIDTQLVMIWFCLEALNSSINYIITMISLIRNPSNWIALYKLHTPWIWIKRRLCWYLFKLIDLVLHATWYKFTLRLTGATLQRKSLTRKGCSNYIHVQKIPIFFLGYLQG